jgi:hypothetical protein
VERAAILHSALDGELSPEDSAALPLGVRDGRFRTWHEQTFGSRLDCLTECPACRTPVEFMVDTERLHFPEPIGQDDGQNGISLVQDGWNLSLRLPDTTDLAAAAAQPDVRAARRTLFERCLIFAQSSGGAPAEAREVPDDLIVAAGERMGGADPLADLSFALCCPNCAAAWEAPLDLAGFFFEELKTWAARLLREIHEIASAYGWSESQILSLPAVRRRAYLDLIRA